MEKEVLYRPGRTAIILNKTPSGHLIHIQLCKLDESRRRSGWSKDECLWKGWIFSGCGYPNDPM